MTSHPVDQLRPDDADDHDGGLARDLVAVLPRRRVLQLFGGAALLALAGCGASKAKDALSTTTAAGTTAGGGATSSSAGATSSSSASTAAATAGATVTDAIPEETGGPYPADGSNGVNVLTESGIVRQDIRSSFGSASGVAEGVPTTVTLTLVDVAKGAPLAGAAVYLWHCDRDGNYSLYSQGVTDENYLRGVQEADSNGVVSFTTIYPACYSGRWPHIHFEVYPGLAEATAAGTQLVTSQIALPADSSAAVYATDGYSQSVRNLAQVSLSTDNVFSDGAELETPTVSGSVTDGYVVALSVGV